MKGYIGQAWLVIVLAAVFSAALAGVEAALKDRIAANKLAATLNEIPRLVGGADRAASATAAPLLVAVGQGAFRKDYEAYRALAADGNQVGWVIRASGKGFADKIELLVGVDANVTVITGLAILDQKETPGLGNKIADVGTSAKHGFLWPFFVNHPRADEPLTVVTGASPKKGAPGAANRILAVTGATISSRSVCDIVNEALGPEVRQRLRAELKKGGR